ncbi:MAG TPA: MFS transporter [Parvibaculum sp.]|uniref:MFS transporter n=1 Tax=Parvibaculum sp. TaxID=2024848 RepID=UPI002B57B4ED|nr:MFS transporter [Parvibaculum sp.]HMM14278.1 MFS transporter [Parvibaculum sp.]
MAEERHSTFRLLAYAMPSITIAALGLPLAVHLPEFYATTMGLGLIAVGAAFTLARGWDVIVDPLLGYVSDKFETRWGRRRVWVVISAPLIMLASFFVFIPKRGLPVLNSAIGALGFAPIEAVTEAYLVGGLLVLYLGFTMLLLAHMSWGAELSDDYNERSRIQGWREGLSVLGVPLVLMLPVVIQSLGGVDAAHNSVEVIGWFIIIVTPLATLLAVTMMGERDAKPQPHLHWREAFKALMTNDGLRRLVIADLFSGISGSALGAMFIFEAKYVWEVGGYTNQLLLLYFFAGVGFVPLVLKLSYRFGKHYTMIGASLFNVCFVPTLFLIPPGNIWVASLILVFLGVNVGTPSVLYRSMMADVGDFDEVKTGQRRTGLFYALLTLTAKVGSAIAIGAVYFILDRIGFKAEGNNTPEALFNLNVIYVAVPFLCNLCVTIIMWGFPIGLKEQQELRRILDERVVEEVEAVEAPVI